MYLPHATYGLTSVLRLVKQQRRTDVIPRTLLRNYRNTYFQVQKVVVF